MMNKLTALTNNKTFKKFPTQYPMLDDLLGGGLPKGKITEIYGEPDIGKTKLIFDVIEECLKEDKLIAYMATSTKSLRFLESRGLNNKDNLILFVTNDETEIVNFIFQVVKIVDFIIIDSIADVLTENEKGSLDMNVNQNMPFLLSKLSGAVYGEDMALLVVNHTIFKNNEIVPRWEKTFREHCSVRIEMTPKHELKVITHKLKPELINRKVGII